MNEVPQLTLRKDHPEDLEPVMQRIDALLAQLHRDIVVAINGAGINAGKTFLARQIMGTLKEKQIPFVYVASVHSYEMHPEYTDAQLQQGKEDTSKAHGVLLLDAAGDNVAFDIERPVTVIRTNNDVKLQKVSQGKHQQIDLWLAIESAHARFRGTWVLGDIRILNEGAEQKGV